MGDHLSQLKTLIEFRKKNPAPVDTMGCHVQGTAEDPADQRFQILIGLMLSSQTRDQMTNQAMNNLKQLKGGCTALSLSSTPEEAIIEKIRCVGFYKTKAGRVKKVAQYCLTNHNGDIPRDYDELLTLPGVGVKMATLAMSACWNVSQGIGVDVHVHKIANRLGWVDTKTPLQTEKKLQELFPKEMWNDVNETLVGFGQTVCKAKPLCNKCPLKDSCSFANE